MGEALLVSPGLCSLAALASHNLKAFLAHAYFSAQDSMLVKSQEYIFSNEKRRSLFRRPSFRVVIAIDWSQLRNLSVAALKRLT